jgi:hypothetical protein
MGGDEPVIVFTRGSVDAGDGPTIGAASGRPSMSTCAVIQSMCGVDAGTAE